MVDQEKNDNFVLAKLFMAGYAKAGPLKWEFVEWFLRDLKVTEEQIKKAVHAALYEWDL